MTSQQAGILALIQSAVTGESLPLPVDFDLEQAYTQICRHQIETLAYDGAVRCGIDKRLPVMQKLFGRYVQLMLHSEKQMQAVTQLCAAFDKNRIDYLPLKGCNMKKLYPKPELRRMGDADILIRTEQYDRIRPVVSALGLQEKVEGEYDFVWHSDALKLELHKRLVGESNRDFYSWFGEGWQLARPVCGTRYAMSPEAEYLYLFTHFSKHYRDGGIGIRQALDLWVFRRSGLAFDESYVDQALKKMHLEVFHANILRMLSVWFDGAEPEEKTDYLTDYIFRSGSWGIGEAHTVAEGMKDVRHSGGIRKGRLRRIWKSMFPGLRIMRHRYPVLEKHPELLPILWPVRLVTAVLFRRDHLRQQKESLNHITADQILTYQQALNYVGLDFHFKE